MSKTPFDHFEERPAKPGHWRNSFDSRYLRYFWLNGKPRIVTIVAVEELVSSNKRESKEQLLITLAEAPKKWAINVTNCAIIEKLTGRENHQEWVGVRVELYETTTRLPDGSTGPCMRVREKLPSQTAKTNAPTWRQEVSQYVDEIKRASGHAELQGIIDRATEDQSLEDPEFRYIERCRDKRADQITGAPTHAQQ